MTGRKYAKAMFGNDLNLMAYITQPRQQAEKVKVGDMSAVETMLVARASTLDMIFNRLASQAASSEYLSQMEAHLRPALKAQAQCRATLEALTEIKNPRPVAFVRQANIAPSNWTGCRSQRGSAWPKSGKTMRPVCSRSTSPANAASSASAMGASSSCCGGTRSMGFVRARRRTRDWLRRVPR